MARILAIETATEQMSLALLDGSRLTFEMSFYHGRELSRLLIPSLKHCMELSGQDLKEVDAVAISVGPGSFTGLRIGVTAAKTLAYAIGRSVVPVSTLEAMALHSSGACTVPLIDARREEVFTAVFNLVDGKAIRLVPDQIVRLADLPQFIRNGSGSVTLVAPPASPLVEETIRKTVGTRVQEYPQARHVATLAAAILEQGGGIDPVDLIPAYIRRSYAEEKNG